MDTMADGVFEAATFYKLAEMFNSPFRDEANKLLGLALSDLRKSHNLLCDQCGDAGYAKARRDECAGLRYDLRQAFARYADGELNADDVREIIARVAERCAEIEDDVSAPCEIPIIRPGQSETVAFADFVIPPAVALPPVVPIITPESVPDSEHDSKNDARKPFEVRLREKALEALEIWPENLWSWAFLLSMLFWFSLFAVIGGGLHSASEYLVSWSRLWFWLLVWPLSAAALLLPSLVVYENLRFKIRDADSVESSDLDGVLDFIKGLALNKTLCGWLCLITAFVVFMPAITSDGFKLQWPSLSSLGWLPEIAAALVAGFVLLWLLRKTLPYLGWIGLSLKVALAVDCLFVCYLVGFHETPWSFMHGGPFPSLARPVYPFVITCVLAAGVLVLPEVAEWIRARPSRLRKVLFTAAVLIAISIFVVRDRLSTP